MGHAILMWDAILGWTFSIVGGLALGVIGNLLTPKAIALWASLNGQFANRKKAKLVDRYQQFLDYEASGTLHYRLINGFYSNTIGFVLVSSACTMSTIIIMFYFNKITTMNESGKLEWINDNILSSSNIVSVYAFSMSFIAASALLSLYRFGRTAELYRFAVNRDLYEQNLYRRLKSFDPNAELPTLQKAESTS